MGDFHFLIKARHLDRPSRKAIAPPAVKPILTRRGDDIPVTPGEYALALVHLRDCWGQRRWFEFEWFVMSLRGQLPPEVKPKNFTVTHITLPPAQYFAALEALTTRLGVKLANGTQQG